MQSRFDLSLSHLPCGTQAIVSVKHNKKTLRDDANITWKGWHGWVVKSRKETRAQLRHFGVSPTFRGVDEMAEKCDTAIDEAISEYQRRLEGRHGRD